MKRLGKYEILREIGRGGFAIVYEARNVALDRTVALKVLHPHWSADPSFATRFQREARAAANLRHPNIVTVHDAGEADGQLYIAMEYLPGRTLQQLLEEGPLTIPELAEKLEIPADEATFFVMTLRKYGIMVNVLLPGGAVDTGGLLKGTNHKLPFQLLSPDIMADPIVFLASSLADGMTGERIIAKEFDEWLEIRGIRGITKKYRK